MSDKYVPNLGEEPHEDAQRDAVHIAVIPLIYTNNRYSGNPGTPVKLVFGTQDQCMECLAEDPECIGIIDPFRTWGKYQRHIENGDRVWVLLKPNTITYLRHHWEHPAFDKDVSKLDESEVWLCQFAARHSLDFEELIFALKAKNPQEWRVVASSDLSYGDIENEE